ncbi:MAG: hypothetical protein ACLTWK_00555 [Eisenbergiella sp.]
MNDGSNRERKEVYSIEQIREATKDVLYNWNNKKSKILLDGDYVRGNSLRFRTFFEKGCNCTKCGIEGKFFAKERYKYNNGGSYHLELYAVDPDGNEIIMTKGIKDADGNRVPLCQKCHDEIIKIKSNK